MFREFFLRKDYDEKSNKASENNSHLKRVSYTGNMSGILKIIPLLNGDSLKLDISKRVILRLDSASVI